MLNTRMLAALAMCTVLAACSLKPETLLNAGRAHQTFPSLALAVQDCVASQPVRAEIVEPFNTLLDAWTRASELEADEQLIVALVGAQAEIERARVAWVAIRDSIRASGLDCGPYVRGEADNVETTFSELMAAVRSNERLVVAGQWAQVVGRIFLARPADVRPMSL